MVGIRTSIPLAVLAVGLLACGSPATKWVGEWQGQQDGLVRDDKDDVIAQTLRRVTLTVGADGTFTLVKGGVPYQGTVLFGAQESTLQVTSLMDRQLSPGVTFKPIVLTMAEGGTLTMTDPNDFQRPPVKLKRTVSE